MIETGIYILKKDMEMLTISNMKWSYKEFARQQDLMNILANRLAKLQLAINAKVVGSSIVFNDVETGVTFKSNVVNKVNMKPTDPRIQKKGRQYLQTKRPTKKQYFGFYETIQDVLDKLGLNADVVFTQKKGKEIVLRKNKDKFNNVPQQKSYPVEM